MLLDNVMNNPAVPADPIPAPIPEPVPAPAPTPDPTPEQVAPTTPVEPVEPATSEPAQPADPQYRLPGQYSDTSEVEWLRQNYAQALNQIQAYRQKTEEFELASLTDEERAVEQFKREKAEWSQQMDAWRQQQAVAEWRTYYQQFVDDPDQLASQADVVQMGHQVLSNLHKQLSQAQEELIALKKAGQPPKQPIPPVTTNAAGGSPSTKTIRDLMSDTKEFERLLRKAEMGQLADGDIPS